MGKQGYGIDPERLSDYARQIKEVSEMGVQIGIVIGGGNIFRGLSGSQKGFDRVKGDQMGMCATVINSLALSSALGAIGVKNKVMTAIRMEPIGEFYTKWKAIEAMEQGEVCIFSAGTGNPYFTTDTGSSLRGIEIEADAHDAAAKCVENGLLIITAKNLLRMLPPLTITQAELDEAVQILKKSLKEID